MTIDQGEGGIPGAPSGIFRMPTPPSAREEFLLERIRKLNAIGCALSRQMRDLDRLLNMILEEARRFYRCDAGSLYTRDGDNLVFRCAQNDTLKKRPKSAGSSDSNFVAKPLPISKRSIAGFVAATGEILVIDDVYELGGKTEYQFDRSFDNANNYRTRSILAIPMVGIDDQVIGVLQLINPLDSRGVAVPFGDHQDDLARSLASQAAIALTNGFLIERTKKAHLDTITRLAVAAEYKDMDTAAHIERMSRYSALLSRVMGMDDEYVETMRLASPMHDVGKIGIPDAILLKPGKLTDAEFDHMKKHTEIGARILAGSDVPLLQMSERIALCHHEKWDGTGYPRGLHAEEIPIEGRIVALADVFDALTSKRCYKPAFTVEKALEIIREGRGKHFDPRCVEAFLSALGEVLEIKKEFG
jgi:HD-GYP domain-containing protein (c-di-GMP phosphodiesterase class II)